ncbi:hypothetical protein D3C78_1502110 [compost metagenome]
MQIITQLQLFKRCRHHQQIAAFQARTDDILAVQQRYIFDSHSLQIRVTHRHVHGMQQFALVAQAAFKRLRLLLDVNAEKQAYQPHHQ